jgi:hypothetical protein
MTNLNKVANDFKKVFKNFAAVLKGNGKFLMLFFIVILLLILVFKSLNSQKESFYPWDDHNTKKIIGNTWKYNNPTTKIEYELEEVDPFTKEKNHVSPITFNSYVETI